MGAKARNKTPRACGVLLVDKPAGVTSHDVVGWARRELSERAIGHCGTLDPAATGLLVLCVGPATKFVEQLSAADKSYRARFVLGEATDTADADGRVTARADASQLQDEALVHAVQGLVGPLELPPPAFSAVRVDGVRAHDLARKGEAPALADRPMEVFRVTDVVCVAAEPAPPDARPELKVIDATLRVRKGTYIRSLAVELGRRLGVPARLDGLRRTAVGAGAAEIEVEHLACVADLEVESRIAAHEGKKPRVRLRRAALGAPGETAAQLIDVADLLGWPRVDLGGLAAAPSEQARAGFERLQMGQRLAWASPEAVALRPAGSLADGGPWLICGPVEADGAQRWIVAAYAEGQKGRGPALRSLRSLRMWPPGRVRASPEADGEGRAN